VENETRFTVCDLPRTARITFVHRDGHEQQSEDENMAVRVFTDREGHQWTVWRVQPTASTASLQERFQGGWLCFEREDGGARARLPLDEAPPAWDALPDERLELLSRVAEVASRPRGITPPEAHRAQEVDENAARDRPTGSQRVIGPDDS
jgi:hypothetical protein